MTKGYVVFFLLVISIPLMMGLNAWQGNKCGVIENEIKDIEEIQEKYVRENKTVVAEIAGLLAADQLDADARKKGLRKLNPEDIIVIVMRGKGRGL